MEVSATKVKELREKTGAGFMDCKKALAEVAGDFEKAVEYLRQKGLAAAQKKADRVASEGTIAVKINVGGNCGVIVEINSETDFVAKNEEFLTFSDALVETILNECPSSVQDLLTKTTSGGGTVQERLNSVIAKIGENIVVRRFAIVGSESSILSSYVHGGGKIGVVVELLGEASSKEKAQELAKDIAMHIAASNPQFLSRKDVPAQVLEKEKEIFKAQALESGKPANIVDKIAAGRIEKFYSETCLLEQAFVKDPDITIARLVENFNKEASSKVELKSFVRYFLGEGIEKKSVNFAEEVASQLQK